MDGLSDPQTVEVAAQVLDALAHAHRTGIVHRDVKPSNILLEHRDEIAVRLLDFGLAQFDGADTLTAVGDVPGTLAYIAPERLAGREATPESDVWAVGVLLWESLAGRHPFWGVPLQQVARAIEAGAPPLAIRAARRAPPAARGGRRRSRTGSGRAASRLRAGVGPPLGDASGACAHHLEGGSRPRPRACPRPGARRPRRPRRARGARRRARRDAAAVLAARSRRRDRRGRRARGAGSTRGWGSLVALAAPVFPLGNLSAGAATLYGGRRARPVRSPGATRARGLLFPAGRCSRRSGCSRSSRSSCNRRAERLGAELRPRSRCCRRRSSQAWPATMLPLPESAPWRLGIGPTIGDCGRNRHCWRAEPATRRRGAVAAVAAARAPVRSERVPLRRRRSRRGPRRRPPSRPEPASAAHCSSRWSGASQARLRRCGYGRR